MKIILVKIKTKKELGGKMPSNWVSKMEYLYGRIIPVRTLSIKGKTLEYRTIWSKENKLWSLHSNQIKYKIKTIYNKTIKQATLEHTRQQEMAYRAISPAPSIRWREYR